MVERNRAMTPSVFGGMAGEEILVKTGVLAEGAGRLVPTLGGLLAAGVYPQQFFPRLNIVLTVRGTGETRSINGPVPPFIEEPSDFSMMFASPPAWLPGETRPLICVSRPAA